MGPLDGLRVIDIGVDVAAPFCARLLAELGADVIRVEPPQGDGARRNRVAGDRPPDPERAPIHLWVNGGKRGVTLDWRSPGGRRELGRLVADADVLVHSEQPASARRLGLLPEQLAGHERLVTVAVTPFGLTGPLADRPATDLTLSAASGLARLTGDPNDAPLTLYGYQPQYQGGTIGALSAMAALFGRSIHGHGDYIDVSILECMSSILEEAIQNYTYRGEVRGRTGNRMWFAPPTSDFYKTRDGVVGMMVLTEPQWQQFTLAVGHPEWCDDPRFADWESRRQNGDALVAALVPWFASRTTAEAIGELQALRIPSAPAQSLAQLLDEDPQIQARDFLVTIDHPRTGPLRYPGDPTLRTGPPLHLGRAPLLGEHNAQVLRSAARPAHPQTVLYAQRMEPARAAAGPLSGLRVLDLTQIWAGPYATLLLSDLGATVVHVEGPTRPDLAHYVVTPPGLEQNEDAGSYFHANNRGKLSLSIDLGSERGRQLLLELIPRVDVVVNNFSARVMGNLGANWEEMSRHNPGIIMLSMPAFGATGPFRDFVCLGEALEGAVGLVRLTGYDADRVHRAGIAYPDPCGGIAAALAVTGALLHRQRTGEGQFIDLSQRDACIRLIGEALLAYQLTGRAPETYRNRHPEWSPHGIFPCRGEDRWLALAVRDDAEWAVFCRVAGIDPPAALAGAEARLQQREQAEALVTAWTRGHTEAEALATLAGTGIPAEGVLSIPEVLAHPQHVHREFFPEIEHPVVGRRRLWITPLRFRRARVGTRQHAPLFGAHSRQVLRDWLNTDDAELDSLERDGIIGRRPVMEPAVTA